jgi:HEXXH motif-containing protein
VTRGEESHPDALDAWDGPGVLAARYEKSATALVAVARTLRRSPLFVDAAAEFLELYDRVADLPVAAFTRVWSTDPGAYLWVHRAFDLVAACIGGAPATPALVGCVRALGAATPDEALVRHCDEFKGLALAVHLAADRDCRFDVPWTVSLPWAIPGTALSVEGSGRIRIGGVADGALQIVDGERRFALAVGGVAVAAGGAPTVDTPWIRACPVVRHAGYEVRLQPHAFHLPGIEDAASIIAAGIAYQEANRAHVAAALALVERFHPESFAEMREYLHVIALKPLAAGGFTNLTHSDLPGAFVAGLIHNPYELADTFIHEMYHGRLFALEDVGPFFDQAACDALGDERYYSPWRDDLRPLRGILHAVYVYVPVCVYWQRLLASGAVAGDGTAYALDRVLRIPLQLELGLGQLEGHAVLTVRGRELLDRLRAGLVAIRADMIAAHVPDDAPALVCAEDGTIRRERSARDGRALSVRDAVREHAERAQEFPGRGWSVPLVRSDVAEGRDAL